MNKRQLNRYFPIFVLPTFVAFCIGFIYPFLVLSAVFCKKFLAKA